VGDLKQRLIEAMGEMPVIDAHEHLPPEKLRVARDVDVFTLFGHYTQTDLESAGMTQEQYDWLQEPDQSLTERWKLFEPFYQRIKYTSYARAARLAARKFYGADISPDSYVDITEQMKAGNTRGIYKRVMRDTCNIKVALTQIGRVPESSTDLLVPILPIGHLTGSGESGAMLHNAAEVGVELSSLADCDAAIVARIANYKKQGVVGFKMTSADLPEAAPDAAAMAFDKALCGEDYDQAALNTYLMHRALDLIGEAGLVVAVHCGIIWNNWNNFYDLHPKHMIPVALAHRNTRFDLYHGGIPWTGDIGVMAKELPNVWLNMCWCHVISQQMSIRALDEWLDLVPVNKIIGFGGDYHYPVEKIYGHLVMAREDIATVLARRVGAGLINYGEALELARMMFFDNPRDLYGLSV